MLYFRSNMRFSGNHSQNDLLMSTLSFFPPILTFKGTSAGVKYAQTIDFNELLNTLQRFGFPGLLGRDTRLLLLVVLLCYCTNIFDILTKHALIRLKFISPVRHLVLIKISGFESCRCFN